MVLMSVVVAQSERIQHLLPRTMTRMPPIFLLLCLWPVLVTYSYQVLRHTLDDRSSIGKTYQQLHAANIADQRRTTSPDDGLQIPSTYLPDPDALRKFYEDVDFMKVSPSDPRFLDLPWPSEGGSMATAYARHVQWKRRLSDSERLRWERWAAYQRLGINSMFQYSVEDFIAQGLRSELESQAAKLLEEDRVLEAQMCSALELGLNKVEAEEVSDVMKAYYKLFNNKNIEGVRDFWLPFSLCELVLPGYPKARGSIGIDRLYRKLYTEVKPFCKVTPQIMQVSSFGNVAIAYTLEQREKGTDLCTLEKPTSQKKQQLQSSTKQNKRTGNSRNSKDSDSSSDDQPYHLLAVTVLRKINKQWRFLLHHVARAETSAFAANMLDVRTSLPSDRYHSKHATSSSSTSSSSASRETQKSVAQKTPLSKESLLSTVESLFKDAGLSLPSSSSSSSASSSATSSLFSRDSKSERKPTLDAFSDSREVLDETFEMVSRPARARLTVQAVRDVTQLGYLSTRDKDILLEHLVSCIARDERAFVEQALELLLGVGEEDTQMPPWSPETMHRFAQQCKVAVREIQREAL